MSGPGDTDPDGLGDGTFSYGFSEGFEDEEVDERAGDDPGEASYTDPGDSPSRRSASGNRRDRRDRRAAADGLAGGSRRGGGSGSGAGTGVGRGGGQAGPPVSRLATIAVIIAVVALSAFIDRSSKPSNSAAVAASLSTAMPLSSPAAALSSSWFCAGPTGSPGHLADGRLVVANATSRSLTGTVRFIPSSGTPTTHNVMVGASGSLVIPEPVLGSGDYLGAVVELDGGHAAVQQVVSGTEGTSSSACATAGSNSWYFPAGTTQENSNLTLSLLNPFPSDAIADLSFTTEQGQEDPQDFQGLVIPAGTMVGLDLGSHLRDRASVATTVTLRVGELAAFETETVQPQTSAQKAVEPAGSVPWSPGVALTLGTPSPGTSWWWPSGAAASGDNEQYVMYNPTNTVAQVSLGVDLDQGSADPFQVTVQPFSVAVVTSNTESRIPLGIGHAAWLRSTNGVGVVAERVVMAVSPASQTGLAEVMGSRLQAGQWLVPGDADTDTVNPTLVVYNPGTTSVTVSINALAPPPSSTSTSSSSGTASGAASPGFGRRTVTVQPGQRYVLSPSSAGGLLVAASGQVVVEGDTSPAHGIGIDAAIGVPLS